MTWAGRTADSTPSRTDYEDAVTNEELMQELSFVGMATGHVLTASEVEANIRVSGYPGGSAGAHCATRAEVEAVRTWRYTKDGDAPSSLTAGPEDGLGRVPLSWTNVTTMPAWAEAITEVSVERDSGAGFSEVHTLAHNGASSQSWTDPDGDPGDDYRVRYKGTRDTSLASAYSNTDTA